MTMPAPLLPEEHVTVEMDMDKHTPGPWICTRAGRNMRDEYCQSWAIGESTQPNLIAGCFRDVRGGEDTAEANARFITHACNCHDDLLAALKGIRELVRLADHSSLEQCSAALSDIDAIALHQITKAEAR